MYHTFCVIARGPTRFPFGLSLDFDPRQIWSELWHSVTDTSGHRRVTAMSPPHLNAGLRLTVSLAPTVASLHLRPPENGSNHDHSLQKDSSRPWAPADSQLSWGIHGARLEDGNLVQVSQGMHDASWITIRNWPAPLDVHNAKFYDSRQKISIKGERSTLGDDAFLKDVEGAEVSVKDLGPQVSWRTVFLVEYVCISHCAIHFAALTGYPRSHRKAGPLVIHPLIYYLSNTIYRRNTQHSLLQKSVGIFFNFRWFPCDAVSLQGSLCDGDGSLLEAWAGDYFVRMALSTLSNSCDRS